VKNLGVTYDETGFDVNTIIEFDGAVIYDYTTTVVDLLAPGATAAVTFPNITIPNESPSEGTYKVTMKTLLVGDDHSNNDKKTLTYSIVIPYDPPPMTWAEISGTMGQNGWFVSCVTVTLYAIDPDGQWPSDVNHTYYKVDSAQDWIEYLAPFDVCEDGMHIVYFYSVDKAGNYEEVQTTDVFKIDQTAPSISMSVEKVGFRQWKFIANVYDQTSQICLVQCYIDDMLIGNITKPGPYEWSWTGKGNHTVTGIAYDNAGNSAENDVVFSYALNEFQHQRFMFLSMIVKIIQRILSHFPMLSEFPEMLTTSAHHLS
jgi:hypothetical protein